MGLAVMLAVAAGALLACAIVAASKTGTGSPREDEVLPSHYSSLLESHRTHYPGHCPVCGTDNEPGYRFCGECGSAIPTTDGSPTDADIGWIVDG